MAGFGSAIPNAARDFEASSDGITSLRFSPVASPCLLVATSWDQQVRCWEIQNTGVAVPKAATSLPQPVLCCAWSPDGTAVFAGGCDNSARLWNLQTNQSQQVGAHEQPVRHLDFINEASLLVTASWDKSLRYWDLRQQAPVQTVTLPERIYACSVAHPLLVVGLANRRIQVYNLSNPLQPYKELDSPLKFQTRCVTCFPDSQGYLLGSVEGRVACQWVAPQQESKNFTFKCHRDQQDIYAVNSIAFHPQYGTFATAGSDGTVSFWDKDAKQRLKNLPSVGQAIPCAAFSTDGSVYAYAASYDWGKGYGGASGQNRIILHPVIQSEIQPKPKQPGR